MKRIAVLAVLLVASEVARAAPEAAPAATGASPRRRALVVGIDHYAASPRWMDLEGAANDARDVAALLVARFGYRPEDVTVLLDGQATRQAILDAYRRVLVEPAGPGELGVFYYAGHGSQVKNLLSPKPGHLDETIVPSDGQDIRDVELGRLAEEAAARGLRLTVVLDSCHSGSATRGLVPSGRTRAGKPDLEHVISDGSPRPAPDRKGVLILSAARAEQLAGEAVRDGRPHGAFTAALLDTLAASSPDASAEAIHVRAHALVKALRAGQDPGIEGTEERRRSPPFAPPGRAGSSRPVVAVAAVMDGEVELLGGAAMGLAEGATLVRQGDGPRLRLTVTSVLGFARSRARVTGPAEGAPALPATGELFEVERYALGAPEPLRLDLGDTMPLAGVLAATRALAPLRASKAVHLVADPLELDPTHTLSWRGGAWVLRGPEGATTSLGPTVDAARLARLLGGKGVAGAAPPCAARPCLFVRLPAPAELVAGLHVEARGDAPVVAVADPGQADYLLAGRLGQAGPEYTLLKRDAVAGPGGCAADHQLPARGEWLPAASAAAARAAGEALDDVALRIGRIHAWLTLRAPQDDPDFPWRLELSTGGRPIDAQAVRPGAKVALALVRTGPGQARRYPYVFAIDCKGAIDLAWPEALREPDQLPGPGGAALERIPLQEVELDDTVGRYTFLLLASDEPLPSLGAILQQGVKRSATPGPDTLGSLFLGLGRTRAIRHPPKPFSVQRVGLLADPDQARAAGPLVPGGRGR